MAAAEKQYGLIEAKTGKKLTVNDVFNNDSDSSGEHEGSWLKKCNQKEEKVPKKQTKLEIQRALQQDPTVYQYDEIYEEMAQKKQEAEQLQVNPEKKPKYIHDLMKTADRRKKENERRLERQIQKEREAEGDMYKDKDEFITSSYKQKLEEFKKAEEEEKRMEYIESVMDVSKQQDLGGFYRHLYKETISDQNLAIKKEDETNELEAPNPDKIRIEETASHQMRQPERNYRKRNVTPDSEPDEKKSKKESESSSSSNSDSSSDSSSTSSSSDEEKPEKKEPEVKAPETKSGPEDGEILDTGKIKNKVSATTSSAKPSEKSTKSGKNEKEEHKDDKSRNVSKNTKSDDRDRRDRSYRSSGYDRDKGRDRGRDDRSYRERDRGRRDDRRDRKRSSDSRRRRSRSRDNRRGRHKSRDRSKERSRSRRDQERSRNTKEVRDNDVKKKKEKENPKPEVVEPEVNKTKTEEEVPKVNIWEKRTVGPVLQAALERYLQRKALRGS